MHQLNRRVSGVWFVTASALVLACGGGSTSPNTPTPTPPAPPPPVVTPVGPVGPFAVGSSYLDPRSWVQYTAGDAPIIVIAPHGGLLSPGELADRSCTECVTANDTNTQDLARVIADTFTVRTGRRPHLIVNLLHRRKFDANRDLTEATVNNTATLRPTWEWMHAAVDTAKADVTRRWQRGLVLDMHGHAHAIPRLELGYLLTGTQLRLDDAALAASNAFNTTSTARLLSTRLSGRTAAQIFRGPSSLGGLLEARGVRAVPSPAAPAPLVGEDYFNGGYNTLRHGSRASGSVDAIQIECHFTGVRDTPESRARFASALVDALLVLLREEYGWQP